MGANEFREFLTFYPTNAKADVAQFHLAMCHQKQMRAAERDQTETKESLKEYQVFFDRYPNSPLMPEVRAKWREARDRLSMASYRVGRALLPLALVSRRRGPFPRSAQRGSGIHGTGRRLLLPGRFAAQGRRDGR